MKKFTLYTALFVFFTAALIKPLPSLAAEAPEIAAEAYILMDMETGQVLAEKNADQRRSPASTTKIMSALVAIENNTLDKAMSASQKAIDSVPYDYSRAGIRVGETLTFRSLLDFMLITSANEAANIIAENTASDGTVSGFAAMMNSEAEKLGLTGTHFTNPGGEEDPNHYSTARDLAILARAAMKNDIFRETVGRIEFSFPETNLRSSNQWDNSVVYTNQLLLSRSSYYSKVTGIKTGWTELAGRCLVSSAVNPDGLELISVILGAATTDLQFSESQKLLEYGFKNFSMQQLVLKGKYVDRLEVEDAVDGKKVDLLTSNEISRILPKDENELKQDLTQVKTLDEPFKAPIEAGQVLGSLEYFYKGVSIGSVDLVAKEGVEKTTFAIFRDKYMEVVSDPRFMTGVKIAGGALVFFIILVNVLRVISRKRNRRRRYNYTASKKGGPRRKNYR